MTFFAKLRFLGMVGLSLIAYWLSNLDVKGFYHLSSGQAVVIHCVIPAVIKVMVAIYWLLWLFLEEHRLKKYRCYLLIPAAALLAVLRLVYIWSLCE